MCFPSPTTQNSCVALKKFQMFIFIGLTLFVNDEEVGAHKTHGTVHEVSTDWDRRTYFGRALTNMRNER